jgi:hypothetical protein
MNKRDGTGPQWQSGRATEGAQSVNRFCGSGRNKGLAEGPIGECVCLKCGTTIKHTRREPCTEIKCPSCGEKMTRKE